MIRRYKIGEKLSDEFFTTWVFLSVEKRFLTTAQQRGIGEETFFSKVDMPGSFRGVLYELHLSWNLSSKTIRHFSVDK